MPGTRAERSSLEFLDLGLDSFEVGTSDLVDLGSTLVELESWHGLDAAPLGGLAVLVDIDLVEEGLSFDFLGEFLVLWCNHLAGRAPRSREVNHHQLICLHGFVEFSLGFQIFSHLVF